MTTEFLSITASRKAVEWTRDCYGHTEHSSTHTHTQWTLQLLFSDIPNPKKPHTFCKAQYNSPPKTHGDGELLRYSTYFTACFKTQKSRINSFIHIQCLTWSLELLSFTTLGVYMAFCITKQHCHQSSVPTVWPLLLLQSNPRSQVRQTGREEKPVSDNLQTASLKWFKTAQLLNHIGKARISLSFLKISFSKPCPVY